MNIKEIAKEAGVSIASVSRYFNNRPLLSTDTAQRIEEVVKKHSYLPNSLGRSLRISRSGKLLVLLPSISNPIYSKILRAMSAASQPYGYIVLTCATENNPLTERALLHMLHNHYADGAVFFSSALPPAELEALARRFPVVQCLEYAEGANISTVTINNEEAAFEAVNYLAQLGHTRIAMLSGDAAFESTLHREAGYFKALKKNGLPVLPDYLLRGQYGFNSGVRGARALLSLPQPPTAIFAVSDALAVGAVREGKRLGKNIGREFSVIGFDDSAVSSVFMPTLTSVNQPRAEMGKVAFDLFFERLNNPRSGARFVTLPHRLVVRESARE